MAKRQTKEAEAPAAPEEVATEPEAPDAEEVEIEDIEDESEAPDAPEEAPEAPPAEEPIPEMCPYCADDLRVIASMLPGAPHPPAPGYQIKPPNPPVPVGFCAECGAEVARGKDVVRHIGRISIGEAATKAHGLKPDDLVEYLPSAGSGGIKITHAGRGVKLYTKAHGTLVWRIPTVKE